MVNKGANKIIIVMIGLVITLFLVAGFLPEAQNAAEKMQGEDLCTNEGCYYNNTVNVCYNGSDQGANCAATIQTKPLNSLFTRNGMIFLIIMATILIGIVGGIKAIKKLE